MDAIAYGATRGTVRAADKIDEPARQRHGWFTRFMAALDESRRRQAEREIRKYADLMSHTADEER